MEIGSEVAKMEREVKVAKAYSKFRKILEKYELYDFEIGEVLWQFPLDVKAKILRDLAKRLRFKITRYKR